MSDSEDDSDASSRDQKELLKNPEENFKIRMLLLCALSDNFKTSPSSWSSTDINALLYKYKFNIGDMMRNFNINAPSSRDPRLVGQLKKFYEETIKLLLERLKGLNVEFGSNPTKKDLLLQTQIPTASQITGKSPPDLSSRPSSEASSSYASSSQSSYGKKYAMPDDDEGDELVMF
jgi:hypothetical protein